MIPNLAAAMAESPELLEGFLGPSSRVGGTWNRQTHFEGADLDPDVLPPG